MTRPLDPIALCAAVFLALAAGACDAARPSGTPVADGPEYVIANRTTSTIAVAPRITVPPCSTNGYSELELRAAGRELERHLLDGRDMSWVPPGAVFLDSSLPGAPLGPPVQTTIVITSDRGIESFFGPVPSGLPECGGPYVP